MSSVRACINIFPDPKNEAALLRVALPLQSDSFLVFLFLVRSWFSHWFSARLGVEARRSAAFEAPTGLCSIQGAATSTRPDDTLHPVRLSSRALAATVHWCMSKHPQFWSVSSFFPSFYFFFLEMRLSPSSRSSPSVFSSVRLASCLSVCLFICSVFSSSSSSCLFSINIWHLSRHFPEPSRASRAFGAGTLSFQVFQQSLPYPFPLFLVL